MAYGGGGGGADWRQQENERQARINQGMKSIDAAFAGYDDNFYDQRAADYEAFAVPQVERQYRTTGQKLIYDLARRGVTNSTMAQQRKASLDVENAKVLRQVADAGRAGANDLRQQVEGQRSNIVAQLTASADPGSATEIASRTAAAYKSPMSLSPIGDMFADWTRNYLANSEARAYDPSVQPLFSSGGGASGRVVT